MSVYCVCGKECKDVRGLNGHKTYCRQAGGKLYHEILTPEAKQRWKIGHTKAGEVRRKQELERAKTKIIIKCKREECQNPVSPDGRYFCSQSCSAIFNNTGKIKIPRKLCVFCGKEGTQEYCSGKCRIKHRWQIDKERWFAGENNFTWSYAYKALVEFRGKSCELCGWAEVHLITGNIPTEFHHIDGDNTNNRRNNVQLLCPNCHSLTPNFGSLNKMHERREAKLRGRKPNDAATACGAVFSRSDSDTTPHKIN